MRKQHRCAWCNGPIGAHGARDRGDTVFCRKRCRQAAWRVRNRLAIELDNRRPKIFAYADPPFPGLAWMYKGEPGYKGEVDHARLIASLRASYDGWALSTGAFALRDILRYCPTRARVCAWVKPIGVAGTTFGIHNTWEPLIVVPGRELRPGKRDWLAAQPARRGGSTLIGRKPEAFCCWLFELLGMLPGDTLDDLYPGSGMVGRAWREVCRQRRTA